MEDLRAEQARREKAAEMLKRKEAAGIPDSRVFSSPTAEESRLMGLHLSGKVIRDLNMPPHIFAAITYEMTDEGIAERNARPGLVEPSGISLGADTFTKACEQRRDAISGGQEPWEAPNPLSDVADRHVRPGMKGKFLSPTRVDKDGTRGYEVVRDEKGQPIKVRNMILGEMPEERVAKRNEHYRGLANRAEQAVKNQYLEQRDKTAVADK